MGLTCVGAHAVCTVVAGEIGGIDQAQAISLSANKLVVSNTTVMNMLAVLVSWELSEC
jgi:hypothetical protein